MLDRTAPALSPTHTPVSTPIAVLARTELDDTHAVPTLRLPPTRACALRLVVPISDTTTVTLTDPVVGPFVATTLLSAAVPPPKLTTRLALDRVPPDVSPRHAPASSPCPLLPTTLLDDTHAVPATQLRPTDAHGLRSTAPTDVTATVTLTDPVVGALLALALLADSDPPE